MRAKPTSNTAASSFDRASEHYRKGDFNQVVSLLLPWAENPADADHLSLMSRALMHLGRFSDSLLFAEKSTQVAKDASARAIGSALVATAYRRLRRLEDADQAFDRAASYLGGASPSAQAEVAYLRAAAFWEDGHLAEAEDVVELALDYAEGSRAARLLALRGWIEIRKESYHTAAEDFLDALDLLAESGQDDLLLRGKVLQSLAGIACETIDLRLGRQLHELYQSMTWRSTLAREHFGTLSGMRYLAMLEGDLDSAWRLSARGREVAPSPAFQAIAETNIAALAAIVGDKFSMRIHFEDAWAAIQRADWTGADEDARVGLTNFVVEAAIAFSSETRKAITLYQSLTGEPDTRNLLHRDRRQRGFDAMAAARICEAMEKPDEAVQHYQEALRLWTALDYKMRAAIVAKDLFRLCQEERYLDEYFAALRRAPNAWFRLADGVLSAATAEGAALGAASTSEGEKERALSALTPGQRRVLHHLLLGMSAKEAAAALGLSVFTIHNHTRKLFEIFGVKSRSHLMVRCANLNLLANELVAEPAPLEAPAPALADEAKVPAAHPRRSRPK
jgi:tetratricopeptide (TPR) repeat protein